MKLTVQAGRLYLGGELLRGEIGVCAWQLFTRYLLEDDAAFEEEFALMREYGVRIARVNLAPFWPSDWSSAVGTSTPSNAGYYTKLDAFLDAAAAAGVYVHGTLFWRRATIPDLMSESVNALSDRASDTRAYQRAFVAEIAARYLDHDGLCSWAWTNEANMAAWDGAIPPASHINTEKGTPASYTAGVDSNFRAGIIDWHRDLTAKLRAVDPVRLILSGNGGPLPGVTRDQYWRGLHQDGGAFQAQCTHLYGRWNNGANHPNEHMDDYGESIGDVLDRMYAATGKPVVLEEFGTTNDADPDGARAAEVIASVQRSHCPLALMWEWTTETTNPGFGFHPVGNRQRIAEAVRDANQSRRAASVFRPVRRPQQDQCAYTPGQNGDQIVVPDHALLRPAAWTIAAWGRLDRGHGSAYRRLVQKVTTGGGGGGFRLMANASGGAFVSSMPIYGSLIATDGGDMTNSDTVGAHPLREWHHYAITFDAPWWWWFVDGFPVGQRTGLGAKSWQPSAASLMIGGDNNSANWQGAIADVRLFDSALSHRDVRAVMASRQAPTPVGWWRLDGDGDDQSGNGLHGAVGGSVSWQQTFARMAMA